VLIVGFDLLFSVLLIATSLKPDALASSLMVMLCEIRAFRTRAAVVEFVGAKY
jgi:hypothetical protein